VTGVELSSTVKIEGESYLSLDVGCKFVGW
jgi:hypothetical protein